MTGYIKPGLVSVIVASYNHSKYLIQRMESLINQTYENIEILVIDDYSTDNSVDILRSYEAHHKVKLVIRESNGGWVTVSNQGVALTSGEFVIFANCDDGCDPRMIECLVDAMRTNSTAGIAYCRSQMIDEESQLIGDDFAFRERLFKVRCSGDVLLSQGEMSRFLLHSCVIPNLSAALFRRECYVTAGGLTSSYRVCADWDLFFRVAANYEIAYIAQPLNQFRQHKTTIRGSVGERLLFEEIVGLLLRYIAVIDLTFLERIKYRYHVVQLWSSRILSSSLSGVLNFAQISKVVFRFDPVAMVYLPLALMLLAIKLPLIAMKRIKLRLASGDNRNVG